MRNPGTLALRAPAKINLALSVAPPAPPRGYHPIASWFAAIDLSDEIRIEPYDLGEPNRFEIRWGEDALAPTPIDWPIEKDLGVRALRLLEEDVGRALPVALSVVKRIPVGGGLGGGSSNAASVLLGVNESCGLGLPTSTLRTLGQRLGSDIAFFIDGATADVPPRSAIVTGFGERLERVPCPAQSVLLFFPPFGCPTADVYRAFDASPAHLDEPRIRALVGDCNARGTIDSNHLFNDLAEPACVVRPALRDIRAELRRVLGLPVHVTGSGSTLFALVEPGRSADLAGRAAAARPDVRVCPARILTPAGTPGPPGPPG